MILWISPVFPRLLETYVFKTYQCLLKISISVKRQRKGSLKDLVDLVLLPNICCKILGSSKYRDLMVK